MYGALAIQWSRRSMITSLGDSGLPVFHAGHCDWQRPHSVHVAKSSMPFQVKSSILPRPNMASSAGSSKSIGLPLYSIGSSGPSAVGQPLERHVDRRQEDVQVLGVQHDDQEGQHDADVQQQRDGLDDLVAGVAQRMQAACPCRARRTRPVAVREVAGC